MSALKIGPEFHVWVEGILKYGNETLRVTYDSDAGYWEWDTPKHWSREKVETFEEWVQENMPEPTVTLSGEGLTDTEVPVPSFG